MKKIGVKVDIDVDDVVDILMVGDFNVKCECMVLI